ncbi:uncharacterized protein LOC144127903 isoform X2 [Amblyomma americanum]
MGRCCVPGCRGNYQNGPKVRVYCFPRDEVRRKAWLRAIPRKDFTPTEHSRVCELHFHAGDFITTLSHQDELTGKIIEVKRDRLQLKIDAAPSVFPNCPKYLSSTPGRSESPETKKARRENAALQEAMREKEMVIHVEPAESLEGSALVPVQVIPKLTTPPPARSGGVEWNSNESKVLLEHYVRYVQHVGPDKKFRSKREMFKRIAEHLLEETGQQRTAEQCENRYKTIKRRKRRCAELTNLGTTHILLSSTMEEEQGTEREVMALGEEDEAEPQAEQQQQEEAEDNDPELLAELAAMGDEEHHMSRRATRKRGASSALDQQQLLDRLQELHERRERRRDEREHRRDLRHAEQMNLLRRILSVLERQPLTAHSRVTTAHR